MIELFTTAAIINGLWGVTTTVAGTLAGEVTGARADALVHGNWQKLRENLKLYRPDANHDLHKAIYRAYLQATLQVCALCLEEHGEDTDAWFRRELLPNLLSKTLKRFHRESFVRLDLSSEPRWLKEVSLDLLQKIKALDEDNPPLPTSAGNGEFASLLKEYDLLLQPEGGAERGKKLREELVKRVISEINQTYGAGTPAFEKLLHERWFELLCACFQYQLKHNQAVANIFVGKLLAGLSVANRQGQQEVVAFAQVEEHFEALGGEMAKRLEQAQAWLSKEQREGFERVEGLLNDALFLILAIGREEATRIEMLEVLISSGFDRLGGEVKDQGDRLSNEMQDHAEHFSDKIDALPEKIIEAIQDQARSSSFSALHQLPPPPPDFTGRVDELNELMEKVKRGGVTISGLQGMGGVGKTALAVKLANELKPHYPDAQIFLDLKGVSHPVHSGIKQNPLKSAEVMRHVISAYQPSAKLPDSEAELQGWYRSVLEGQRALLLLDNAKDAEQVEPLIPPESCLLIVTSRQHFYLPDMYEKNLEKMTPRDARALLLRIAARIGDQAETIAEQVDYLPLALRLAASALVKSRSLSPADLVRRLQDRRKRLELIDASLSLSYDLLNNELQQRWLRLAVFPNTFDATAAAALWGLDIDAAKDMLAELEGYSLLEWNEATERYRLHDLARDFADARLSDDERTAVQRRHSIHYQQVLSAADRLYLKGGDAIAQGLLLFDRELSNIRAGQAWVASRAGSDDEAAWLSIHYPDAGANILDLRQHSRERILWSKTALSAALRLKERGAEGNALSSLGLAYVALGEARKAIEYHGQAFIIYREIGNKHGEGNALNNLGVAHAALGETREEIECHKRALTISREVGNRRGEVNALNNLGSAYLSLGETGEAIKYLEHALDIARKIGDRRNEGIALGNLGKAYFDVGETRKAIKYYEQALDIAREIDDRRSEGRNLGNLGVAYADLGETHTAIEYCKEALAIAREIGDRGGEGSRLCNLGSAYADLGETSKAIELMEAALKIFEEIESPIAAQVRQWLADSRGE